MLTSNLHPGFSLTLSVAPIASDLTSAVEAMDRQQADLFGDAGAFAQGFALFNCALAAGIVLGPLWTSFAEGGLGWANMNLCLAVFALTGAVIVASFFRC